MMRCRDEYYIAGRRRLYREVKMREKCGGFTKKEEKRNIHAREVTILRLFQILYNFLYSYRILGNCFISLYSRRNAGGGYQIYHIITIMRC
nr:MAG TPA: hypothetical protein [Caudoviricetes sp.]